MEENQPRLAKPKDIVSRGRGMHDHELPQEIAEEIIVRVPAKSAVRFKNVCRQWFNMIKEINFRRSMSQLRLVYWIQNPPGTSAHDHDLYSLCLFKLDERGTKAKKEATLCLPNYCYLRDLSCDSLLLFQGFGNSFDVYDTIAKQQKLLPEIPIDRLQERIIYFSMVYDASKGNYKVVVFAEQYQIEGIKLFFYDLNPREWWREGKWRKSKPPFSQIIFDEDVSIVSIVVQGVLFWIAYAPHLLDYNCFIQPMEIATEKIMERLELPCQPVQKSVMYQLLELKGSICLMHAAFGDELNIWVLKDPVQSFWIKQYNIARSPVAPALSSMLPPLSDYDFWELYFVHVHLTVGSHILLTFLKQLFWYNLDTKELIN